MAIQWAAINSGMVAETTGTAAATTSIWGAASLTISGFFAGVSAAFTAMVATMVSIITAVGTFIMGVLSAIAAALTETIFGIPWAGAILVGIAMIAGALAATGNLGFKEGGISDFGAGTPTVLHGQEAVIPLDERGASFMADVMGMGGQSGGPSSQHIVVQLDGRVLTQAVLRGMPAEVRLRLGNAF